jgi:DNA-binding NarL/FixJ family response regulator
MDLSMPVLDGEHATARISKQSPAVAVLALTMHEDQSRLERVMRAGAAGYVLKRADANELVRAIRAVAEGRSYVDAEIAGAALRRSDSAPTPTPLSEREEDVLRRTAWGASNKDIAEQLGISTKTVETYKARIAGKLGLSSRSEMVRYAVERGWMNEG